MAPAHEQDRSAAPEAGVLVGALADRHRLSVFAAVVLGARSEAAVVDRTSLPLAAVRAALARLLAAGIVVQQRDGLEARVDWFAESARRAAIARRASEPSAEDLGATPEQARRLNRLLRGGRLTEIPSNPAARRAVLDFFAGRFTPGRRYSEAEVNNELGRFHPDTAALRRYLVDEGFLAREGGQYWRAGGTFEVE